MMTSPTELSLDCKPNVYSMLSKSYEEHETEPIQKLQEFVAQLEEEKLKIDAFERELPLCMELLTNVMEASRQELESQRKNQGTRPVLEEFIPLKLTTSSENEANLSADKANWMTSAQLWHQEIEGTSSSQFHPFSSKDKASSSPSAAFPELALASFHKGMTQESKDSSEAISRREKPGTCENTSVCGAANSTQAQRKARRSWSPDLHRRFVDALKMLGGSQVATPRQIRELMKVDGLTNDEVKSHLQKYRLHTRSASTSPQGAVTGQLVVLGGIWVPPEYAAAAAHSGAPASALYGTHPGRVSAPLFSRAPLLPKETYRVIAAPHPPPQKTGSWWKPDNGAATRPEVEETLVRLNF